MNKKSYRTNVLITLVIFFLNSPSYSNQSHSQLIDVEREYYQKAVKAVNRNSMTEFKKYENKIRNYPLYPYIKYKVLHKKKIDDREVIRFIRNYEYSYIGQKAYVNLIYRLSQRKKYRLLVDNYKKADSIEINCLYLRAKIKLKELKDVKESMIPIWLSHKSQPKECNYLFNWSRKNGLIDDELIWQRITLALKANNYRLAKYLNKFISEKNKKWSNLFLSTHLRPKKILQINTNSLHRYEKLILVHGLHRLAKKDFKEFIKLYERNKNNKKLHENFLRIVSNALNENNPFAYDLSKSISENSYNIRLIRSLLNYCIYNSKWNSFIYYYNFLPDSYKADEKLLYWRAKSLIKVGKKKDARVLLNEVKLKRSYYGFLSSSLLNEKIKINHEPVLISDDKVKKVKENRNFKIIQELLFHNKPLQAKRELAYMYLNRKINLSDLNIMNKVFSEIGWHNGAILGFGKTKYFDDITARFPTPYLYLFKKYYFNNYSKYLFLSIARQESAFDINAKSSAGAVGLMQVMPKTGKWMFKKIKKGKKISIKNIYQLENNIMLGASYIHYLIKNNNNLVKSIASYNAGPHNVKKWVKSLVAPNDAWVEFIPFNETQKYVKNIMEYMIVYDWVINKRQTLDIKKLMGLR